MAVFAASTGGTTSAIRRYLNANLADPNYEIVSQGKSGIAASNSYDLESGAYVARAGDQVVPVWVRARNGFGGLVIQDIVVIFRNGAPVAHQSEDEFMRFQESSPWEKMLNGIARPR